MTDRSLVEEKRAPSPEDGTGQACTGGELSSGPEVSWSRELVKQIAKDVGEAVVFHIETMYPEAIAATPSTFPLSVRNFCYSQILAAIEISDAGQIATRLADRKSVRRKLRTVYRKMRASDCDGQTI